jgi:hypothetical protein
MLWGDVRTDDCSAGAGAGAGCLWLFCSTTRTGESSAASSVLHRWRESREKILIVCYTWHGGGGGGAL